MNEEHPCQPGTQPTTNPLSKEHELHAQVFMDSVWDCVAQARGLAAHEIIGILEVIKAKISFDHNVRQANEEVMRMREANRQADAPPSGPCPIIDKNGFPIE